MKVKNQNLLHKLPGTRPSVQIILAVFILFPYFNTAADPSPHNVILFIADGLKPAAITQQTAPTFFKIMNDGVYFPNSHSLFPSYTMSNASALATGHGLGDTGIYGNSMYMGKVAQNIGLSPTPFLENNTVLSTLDKIFSGDFLNQETILKAARERGFSTAIIGKVGPAHLFDHTNNEDPQTILIDDMTGNEGGVPVSEEVKNLMIETGLEIKSPSRGNNGKSGDHKERGTQEANKSQQDYFSLVATKIVLPLFKKRNKPFVLVYWSRDPDGSQHNHGDSLNRLVPGINGPTTKDAIKNADNNLRDLISTLEKLGLRKTTNLILASDHGISTISKESATSYSATKSYVDVPPQLLPPGFTAIDLAQGLDLNLFDPDDSFKEVYEGKHPLRSNGFLGKEKSKPQIIVVANGGSILIYLLENDSEMSKKVVSFLSQQDYVSGLFVNDKYGLIPGTLPFSSIDLIGSAVTSVPSIIINLRSFSTGCDDPLTCSVEVADYKFQQGQGMHGSFSQADIKNFAAALGPDFKRKFRDPAPVSSADLGQTLAYVMNIKLRDSGLLKGRVLREAMPNGKTPKWSTKKITSKPDEYGHRTILRLQQVGGYRYYDAAGYRGRTLGLGE